MKRIGGGWYATISILKSWWPICDANDAKNNSDEVIGFSLIRFGLIAVLILYLIDFNSSLIESI